MRALPRVACGGRAARGSVRAEVSCPAVVLRPQGRTAASQTPPGPRAELLHISRVFRNRLGRAGRSNVGLPTSGRGRTDVRRPRLLSPSERTRTGALTAGMCQRALNERPRSFLRGRGGGRGSPRGSARCRCPRRDRPVLRRRADQRQLLPGAGPRARPEGADHPRDPRMGRRARQGREQLHAGPRRPGRPRAATARGLQRAHVGLARVRRVGRDGRGRLQGLRGPRRVGPAGLARHPARAAARRRRRSARRHDGRVLRGRDRARRRPPSTAASTPSRRRSPGTRCSPRSIATTSSRAAGPRRSRGSASPPRPRSASSAPRASRRGPSTRTSPPR